MAVAGMILGIGSLFFSLVISNVIGCMCTTTTSVGWGVSATTVSSAGMAGAAISSFIGLAAAVLGLILSVNAMKGLKMAGQPAGIAIAGLVCSIIGCVFGLGCTACYALACVGVGTIGL
jgi:hypothetical protein